MALGVGLPATVAAQEEDNGEDETEAAGDEAAAAVIETLELAAAAFYDQVVSGGKVQSPAGLAMAADVARHHREHAGQFADLAGSEAVGEPNRRLLQAFLDQLEQAQSETEVLRLAHDLETALASTHLSQLDDFEEDASVEAASAILPVESQHAVAIGQIGGLPLSRSVPGLENLDLALDVSQFPARTTTTTTA